MTLVVLALSGGVIGSIAIAVIALLTIVYVVGVYNKLVTLQQRYKNAYAQIDVQLQRRYDLIPNLVEAVKGYMAHERETLEGVTQARNQAREAASAAQGHAGESGAMMGLMGAEAALGGALGRLFARVEAYPDLKASQNMMQLSEELTSTENKIAFARQAYNDQVTSHNTYKHTAPPVFLAGTFGHGPDATLLEFETEKIKHVPSASFS